MRSISSNPVLSISLLGNALLFGAVVLLLLRPEKRLQPASSGMDSQPIRNVESAQPTGSRPLPPRQRPTLGKSGAPWEPWLEQLRAAGAPDRILAEVVLADFNDRWQAKLDEMQQKVEQGEADEVEMAALERERELEKEREMRAGLGEAAFRQWDKKNVFQTLNIGKLALNETQSDAIYDLRKNLERKLREVDAARDSAEIDDVECLNRHTKLQAEFDQEFRTALGEELYAKAQGIDTAGSGELRRTLKNLNASDTQFQTLLEAQRQWTASRTELERQIQSDPALDPAFQEKIKALDQARDQEYQRVLGTNGFEAFQKEQDARYTKMKRYAKTWEMDDQQIDYVYRTLQYYEKGSSDYEAQARALERQGEQVDWDAVNQNLRTFGSQTEKALQAYLGKDRMERLKQNHIVTIQSEE